MPSNTSVDQYLTAEFVAIQDRAINLENSRASRINFFLIATGGTIAGLGGLTNANVLSTYLSTISLLASGIILTIGLITLNYTIDDSVTLVYLWRYAARLRRYFVDQNPKIEKYLPFPPYDDEPSISHPNLSLRGSEATLLVINSVSLCMSLFLILKDIVQLLPASLISIGLFPIGLFLQLFYMRRKFYIEEQNSRKFVYYGAPQDE